MMQVIGLYAAFDEGPHQRFQRHGIVVDATQQHRLAHQGNAGIDQPRTRRAGRFRQLARMIGMKAARINLQDAAAPTAFLRAFRVQR